MKDIKNNFNFLHGGGETGELIRRFDWSNTSIGSKENWPVELKNALTLMLQAPIAMCIIWGKEYLQFYNDAFIPTFGQIRHPSAMGQSVKNTTQRWEVVEGILNKVMSGEAVYHEDSKLIINKNGFPEECFLNVSYIPIFLSNGIVGGVQCIVLETTDKVRALSNVKESEAKVRSLIEEAPVATALFVGRDMVIELANEKIIEIWGKGKSVLGKPLAEALPELKGQKFLEILDDVFTTGNSFEAKALFCELVVAGKPRAFYFDFTYKAVRNTKGEIYGVMDMAVDVTEQVLAQEKKEKSRLELLSLFEKSPVGIATLSRKNLTFRMANTFYANLVGRKPKDIIDKPLLEALPELKGQGFELLLQGVLDTGVAYVANEVTANIFKNGVLQKIHVNLTYQPIHEDGNVAGILVVATDVTQQVVTRKKIEESEAHLQLLKDTVPAMIFYLDEEQRYQSYNVVFMDWFKVNANEAIGKTTREFIGEAAYKKVQVYLAKAYAGEQARYQMHAPSRMGNDKWLDIVYTPHINNLGNVIGVIVHATDITLQMEMLKKSEESELFSRDIFNNSPVAKVVYTGLDMTFTKVNENMLNLIGRDASILGKKFTDVFTELANTSLLNRMQEVFKTGNIYTQPEEKLMLVRFGQPYTGYYSFIYKPLLSPSGAIYGIMVTATEISDQVIARQIIETKEKELRDLITAAPIGIAVVKGKEGKFEEVNERFIQISGKLPEQFINFSYWEVFAEIADTYAPILDNVFDTGIRFTAEETEMVLIRHGVSEKIYTTFDYVPIFDSNNTVSKVIVLVIEVTQQVETRKQIEAAVIERTKELDESNLRLKQSNAELEQFAYIASHDLQEPIRKISTFTQMLEHSMDGMSDRSKDYITKIYNSTDRMTKLIRDVLAFSQISAKTEGFETVDLAETITHIKTDFELLIEQKQATVIVKNMPVVKAIPSQMTQLFSNLFSNSLKYTKPDTKPVIEITCTIATKDKVYSHPQLDQNKRYHHITFSDNGIGFDQEHADRIFKIFQRLHAKTAFEGTGIGLSICRKIVNSHEGHISAVVGKNGGAVFNILLPQ